MSEQFAFEQLRRQRSAVHRHKLCLVATAQIMDGVCSQLFSCAAFAFDEHIRGGRRHLPDRVEYFVQCRRVTPDIFEPITLVHLLAERAIFLLQSAGLQGACDQQLDFVQIERLRDKIVGAAFHCFDRDIDGAVGRHHDANRRTRHFQGAID